MASVDQAPPMLGARGWDSLALVSAAALSPEDALGRLQSTVAGLSHDDASARLAEVGANALRSHGARPLAVLARATWRRMCM